MGGGVEGDGVGFTIREGDGVGFAIREGDGVGFTIREGDGVGFTTREGDGVGFTIREVAHMSQAAHELTLVGPDNKGGTAMARAWGGAETGLIRALHQDGSECTAVKAPQLAICLGNHCCRTWLAIPG